MPETGNGSVAEIGPRSAEIAVEAEARDVDVLPRGVDGLAVFEGDEWIDGGDFEVRVEEGDEGFEPARLGVEIHVEHRDVAPTAAIEDGVDGRRVAEIGGVLDELDRIDSLGERARELWARVRRGVVDQQDLAARRRVLRERLDAAREPACAVVADDHDRDVGRLDGGQLSFFRIRAASSVERRLMDESRTPIAIESAARMKSPAASTARGWWWTSPVRT